MGDDCFEIFVARHGQSEGNVRRRQGVDSSQLEDVVREDPPLTEAGRKQGQLLGQLLKNVKFDAFFASPLQRAAETAYEVMLAQADNERHGNKIILLDELLEVGVMEGFLGRGTDYLKEKFPLADFVYERSEEHPTPSKLEREDMNVSIHRARCAIEYIKSKFTFGQTVFIATHGTYLTSFLYAALGLDADSRFRLGCSNSSFNRIKYNTEGKIYLEAANDVSHLRMWAPELLPLSRSLEAEKSKDENNPLF